jgi:23S rRNA pseudouridine2604 synthase
LNTLIEPSSKTEDASILRDKKTNYGSRNYDKRNR